jgi:hypothetical protein
LPGWDSISWSKPLKSSLYQAFQNREALDDIQIRVIDPEIVMDDYIPEGGNVSPHHCDLFA